ncbi:MAG TPA: DNA adenine methylase [Candidatus Angelobacter sp.]|jgi:DNA adenine methylase
MNSPFGWPGGKKNLVKRILPLLPPHHIYVEPFCGSAKLLFAKERSDREVISDANGDLINFFEVAKHRPSALAQEFHTALCHPQQFKSLRQTPPPRDEVKRAFQFLYLTHFSFGSKGEHFGGPRDFLPNKRIELIGAKLYATAERLSKVVIECSGYEEIIQKYDSPQTVFYCDPPYFDFGRNGRYEAFGPDKLDGLFELLANIKGKFLMSEENHHEVVKRVKDRSFVSRRIHTTYSLAAKNSLETTELLISNFAL